MDYAAKGNAPLSQKAGNKADNQLSTNQLDRHLSVRPASSARHVPLRPLNQEPRTLSARPSACV